MEITIKAVVFEHPEPDDFGKFCGYCPANGYYCSGNNTFQEVVNRIINRLRFDLEQRFMFPNHLRKRDWEMSENSVKPPIFADEDVLRLAEKSYMIKISNYKIVEIDVKVPQRNE